MNEFQELFDKQKAYFNTDITKSYEWRIEQLDRLERLLIDKQDEIKEALGKDFKTASNEQAFEIMAPLGTIAFTRSQLKEWMKPVPAPMPKALAATGHTAITYREPYGVSLVIGPFNGPVILLLLPAIAALSAGNTVILKTSEAVPASAELFASCIAEYFEPEAVAMVRGDREVVTQLLALPFDFMFFTGSVKVGKIVMRAAAENLTPVLLELGGQNPGIVDETANIKDAAKKLAWGATAWGGQWCTSPGYAYVHESVVEEFVEEARKALLEMFGPDPKNNPDYDQIISAKEVRRLAALIDQDRVIAGGDFDEEAKYLAPTLLYPIAWSDPIMDDEIFGPILPVLTYSDIKEVVSNIKSKAKPLAAFIFSRNQNNIDFILNSVSFGGGAINQSNVNLYVESMPYGGVGDSGVGSYYGKHGYEALTHPKSILISPADVAIDHLFPPFTKETAEAQQMWFDY
ncbi:aldehyde dehydrogenase family protein [Mucilaginibacter phyllosphaerae]